MSSLPLRTLLLVVAVVLGCATKAPARRGPGGACLSDRECVYGLACRSGADEKRRCSWTTYGSCGGDTDCLSTHVCRDGACTVECATDGECSDGKRCMLGECRVLEASECVSITDCGAREECVNGRCVQQARGQCLTDLDCAAGERCAGGICR